MILVQVELYNGALVLFPTMIFRLRRPGLMVLGQHCQVVEGSAGDSGLLLGSLFIKIIAATIMSHGNTPDAALMEILQR